MSRAIPGGFKFGIISQWYSPEPVMIPKTVADAIVGAGHEVRVLTGFPSYPHGSLYPEFDANSQAVQDWDGVQVLRVRSFLSHDQNAARRIRSFLSFAWRSLRGRRFLRDCDAIYVYGTPMTAAAAALALRIGRGIPYVIHLQDLWPESVTESGMVRSPRLQSALNAAISLGLKSVYGLANHIVVISPGMKEVLVKRGVDAAKISVLLNWDANETLPEKLGLNTPGPDQQINCVYAGNIGLMQDVETIVRAAAEVQDELPLHVSIYGSGVSDGAVRALADDLGVTNVEFKGRITTDEMSAVYDQSDFQLVTLRNRSVFRVTIPSKFQAAVSNGVPVITTVPGDLATICAENEIGLVAEPESPLSLAQAFRTAAELGLHGRAAMASRARDFYWTTLSADKGTDFITSRLEEAAKTRKPLICGENKQEEVN